ncbi:MAG TPA: UDP-N-acetylmuramoyl-tripeptide--D-alanyl-D-alanine ligase [Chthonomonadaceae bacterium]|nr:UDP-N-acetylmuramoyl-tripeptide--D-alanyl-D-alanine ligase [Chthonomonadaceae bacterium]
MEPFTLAWAAEAMGARLHGTPTGLVQGICTDTRRGASGALFFALQGEHTDGHNYVAQAFAAGAVGAVVSREAAGISGPLLVVPDTTRALGDLAARYRRRFVIPIVGVTGSVGKTSTKEMIAASLRAKYNTLANEKNFNNEIGVPLTLFALTPAYEVAVIEMGMRGLGEIDRLAEIAQPTVGAITNIGYAHIERLGSRERIAQAKSELLARLPEGGIAVLPRHDPFYDYLRGRVPQGCRVLSFGQGRVECEPQPEVCVTPVRDLPEGGLSAHVRAPGESAQLALRVPGSHHLQNAAAALAVAVALSVPLTQAAAALESWQGAEGRMVITRTPEGLTVLNDCYNAGPESMQAALATLAQVAPQGAGRVAVLGDMKELGDFAPEAHRLVGRKAAETGLRLLVTVGDLAREIAAEAERHAGDRGLALPALRHFADSEAAAAHIRDLAAPGDAVLIKGSRAMQMETIVAALTGAQESGAHG